MRTNARSQYIIELERQAKTYSIKCNQEGHSAVQHVMSLFLPAIF